MFNIDAETYEITVSKGDSAVIGVSFSGNTNRSTALVTLKDTPDSTMPLWEKRFTIRDSYIRLTLDSADTDFAFGKYWWDLRVIYDDGDVETPMKPAPFKIVEVVGNA